ncbi:hypothetical protein SCUCBS95973_007931 [Sporothrix curviconia]|uniref:NWD NACHT-NTPase N-terminal domain-containing protein n=1 Tax=Sporothrix curviconia TaxID=1260050 RepID=A0ABP0CHW5_9PEZI
MEETKAIYTIAGHEFVLTDQVTQAAKLLLWAKDWIAAEANLDGFTDVTVRISYYTALEPLLRRLGQNAGVTDTLMSEANNHIVDLYQHILEFQLCSVLRFYQSRARTYVHDMFSSKDWKQAALDIKAREEAVNKDLSQINAFSARQELEALNKTSTDALEVMKGF